ncbi:MAG: hypothetical protein WA254_07645, partial [Candidatus Sulfotelmatobacter sp.]
GKISSVTDADARAVGGVSADLGRVFGETARTGHHANIGLLAVGLGRWLGWFGGLSERHDDGAHERKREREREAKDSPCAKRHNLDPETVFAHHKPPDSDARTKAVAIEVPGRRRTEAVQKADFVE